MSGTYSLVLRPAGDQSNVHSTYIDPPHISDNPVAGAGVSNAAASPAGRNDAPGHGGDGGRMSESLLEQIIAGYMTTPQPAYRFAWEGGEPMLMGHEFFRKAMQLQKDYGERGAEISNVIQTNATLIDDESAVLFAEHNFDVEATLDGPSDLHDEVHSFETGGSPHEAAMQGVELLRNHGIEPHVLINVTTANVHAPKRLYRYLKGKNFTHQRYAPRVDFDSRGSPRPWSVNNEHWGSFLKTLFDAWCADPQPASIQRFDAIMQRAAGGVPAMCSLASTCRQRFVIEYNGDVYPCDTYLNPEMKLGNIATHSLEHMWMSEKFRALGTLKRTIAEECEACPYKAYCRGDCPHNRVPGAPNPVEAISEYDSPPKSALCGAWNDFFSYALSDLEIQAHERL